MDIKHRFFFSLLSLLPVFVLVPRGLPSAKLSAHNDIASFFSDVFLLLLLCSSVILATHGNIDAVAITFSYSDIV